jgi:hypothetical protein
MSSSLIGNLVSSTLKMSFAEHQPSVTPLSTNAGPFTISTSQILSSAIPTTPPRSQGIKTYQLLILSDPLLTRLKNYDSANDWTGLSHPELSILHLSAVINQLAFTYRTASFFNKPRFNYLFRQL